MNTGITDPVELVIRALEERGCQPRPRGAGQWEARCPAHEDRKPSLAVGTGQERDALVHCHAGCDKELIVDALGLTVADLFVPREQPRRSHAEWTPRGDAVAVYSYCDEGGTLLFEVCRTVDKEFPCRVPDPTAKSGWRWRLGDTRRVLYRLPDVVAAARAGHDVWVAEGEKDVHSLEAAGVVATCNPGGAGKWRTEYATSLRGAVVTIVADRDDPGLAHARSVAASLRGVARAVRIVQAAAGKDAADHLTAGHGLDDFVPVLDTAGAATGTASSTNGESYSGTPGNDWPDPKPLDQINRPGPFPTHVLPAAARDLVTTVAQNKQVPEEMVALTCLSATAVLAGPRLGITRGRSWNEALALYTAVAMPPGTRKSPAQRDVLRPLYRLQKEMQEQHHMQVEQAKRQFQQQIDVLTDTRASAPRDRKKGIDAEIADLEKLITDLDEQQPIRLLTSNATPEALEIAMARNGGCISMADSEGGQFAILAGRYTQGSVNLELMLKAYDGDSYFSERVHRTGAFIERAVITLTLCVQPAVLIATGEKAAMLEQGLMGRFLFSVPDCTLGTRAIDPPDLDHRAVDQWEHALRWITTIPTPNPSDDPPLITLTDRARKLHLDFQATMEPRLHPETGDLGHMGDWAAKHAGRVLRIAGLLHLLDRHDTTEPVAEDTMRAAITIGEWAIGHAIAVYGGWENQAAGDAGDDQCKAVLRWLRREHQRRLEAGREPLNGGFKARDVYRGLRQKWATRETVTAALDQLVEAGWLNVGVHTTGAVGGRPTTMYIPHPYLLAPEDDVPEHWRATWAA